MDPNDQNADDQNQTGLPDSGGQTDIGAGQPTEPPSPQQPEPSGPEGAQEVPPPPPVVPEPQPESPVGPAQQEPTAGDQDNS